MRPGAQVIAQYYQFMRLGKDGFTRLQHSCRQTALHLARELRAIEEIEIIGDGGQLPFVAFALKEDVENFTVFDVSDFLRKRGWQVPAYTFPKHLDHMAVLLIVVRKGFGHDLAEGLLADLRAELALLRKHTHPLPQPEGRNVFAR